MKTFGCRKVCILGCVIGIVGFGVASLAESIWVFIIFYGIVGGYGLGTMYLPSIVIVSEYFDSMLGLATGIADSGSGIGAIGVPIIGK